MKKSIVVFLLIISMCSYLVYTQEINADITLQTTTNQMANQMANHLLLHQIYGGGGKSETPITHSFIEITNPTNSDVNLSGYQLKYISTRDTSKKAHLGSTNGNVDSYIFPDVTLPAYSSFLVKCASEVVDATKNPVVLEILVFDDEWASRYIDNSTYSISLLNEDVVIDAVSVGAEVSVEGTVISDISKQKSVRRINLQDTDNNSTDFAVISYESSTSEFVATHRPRSLVDGAWISIQTDPDSENEGETPSPDEPAEDPAVEDETPNPVNPFTLAGVLRHIGSYSTGFQSEDGGIAEIVKFNTDNDKVYVVNGMLKGIDIFSIENMATSSTFILDRRIDVSTMIPEFTFGDLTSIDIDEAHKRIAVSVQEADHTKQGVVIFLDYVGNYLGHAMTGVQPDMVLFTNNGLTVLTADEGEPREGYGEKVDPKGSITLIPMAATLSLQSGILQGSNLIASSILDFIAFDDKIAELTDKKVILKNDALPSVDLEPEYIALSENQTTAYVSLQEANAIAVINLEEKSITNVFGLGFKDHSIAGNELDLLKDGTISLQNQNVFGVYMPDGITTATIAGTPYLLTANEGDAREWGDYENITSTKINSIKVDILKTSESTTFNTENTYILGGRSFSIWDPTTGLQVFDSKSDFEKLTAWLYPNNFNASNSNVTLDNRSGKKGPEPEDVKVMSIEGTAYAFIGLERIGGVAMYNISQPSTSYLYDYINTRDYSSEIAGDVSPEGICTVEAKDSPTGYPLLLVSHENSGTVAVYEIRLGYVAPVVTKPVVPETNGNTNSGNTSTTPVNTTPIVTTPVNATPSDNTTSVPVIIKEETVNSNSEAVESSDNETVIANVILDETTPEAIEVAQLPDTSGLPNNVYGTMGIILAMLGLALNSILRKIRY